MDQTSVSTHEANQILNLVERVNSINEICVRVRMNADQSMTKFLHPSILENDNADGEIRHDPTGSGSRL